MVENVTLDGTALAGSSVPAEANWHRHTVTGTLRADGMTDVLASRSIHVTGSGTALELTCAIEGTVELDLFKAFDFDTAKLEVSASENGITRQWGGINETCEGTGLVDVTWVADRSIETR